MLNPQEVATFLTNKFNEQSEATKKDALTGRYPTFSLMAEVDEGHQKVTAEGMLVTINEEIFPILNGFKQVQYTYRAQFFFANLTNKQYLSKKGIIESVIAELQGKEIKFKSGYGILTFNGGTPGKVFTGGSYGSGVQYEFTVSVLYTENAVSSGQKHWLLDGVEIPFLSESVTVETEGVPRKIFTEAYSKVLLTGKTKFYSFRIPYASKIFKSLQQEILEEKKVGGIVHTLSYYDGEAFTKEQPFTAKVSIHRSASSASTRPNGSVYEVTFSDVYSSNGQTLKYSIALINFPFDMNGDDTRYFNSVEEQTKYFEAKAASSSAPFVEILAPNLDNLVITQQVYYNPEANALTQFDYASKNYAIIKVEEQPKTTETETRYFYYFIEKATIGAGGYMLCDLKLDTVQTYFFRDDITFSDCLIERAHLNRFVVDENDPTKVRFVSDPASKIFNSEDGLNFPKRLVSREKLQLAFTGNTLVDQWLNENVAYWVYVFISPTGSYQVSQINGDKYGNLDGKNSGKVRYPIGMEGATSCICYPIYKNGFIDLNDPTESEKIIIVRYISSVDPNITYDIIPSFEGFEEFEKNNKEEGITSYYYSIKISIMPPFDMGSYSLLQPTIEGSNLVFKTQELNPLKTNDPSAVRTSTKNNFGLFWGSYQIKTSIPNFSRIHLEENEPIKISDIVKAQFPQLKFNPKLNGQNFKELVLTASSGDTFTYDIQKLVEDYVGFEYTEPITPEITKYYLRVSGGTGLYEEGTENNYTGLVGSTDTGLAFANSQYAAFIANNKNFYLQSNLKIGASVLGGIAGGVKSALMGNYGGAAAQIGGSLFQAGMSAIDRSLTVDNMKNAPDQLKNANGNVIFNLFSMSDSGTELGLYAEKYSALEGDLKTANSFMDLYGFAFNDVANIKDYANIRKYHNYVKAQLHSIDGNLSNTARNDLRQRFSNGVRFWNIDKVEYTHENYELDLESGAETEFISFYVTPITNYELYYAEKGSTWQEFVASSYSKGEFTISGNNVFRNNVIVTLGSNPVLKTEEIKNKGEYTAK